MCINHKKGVTLPYSLSSPTVARKIRHLVAIKIGTNKMAKGDE